MAEKDSWTDSSQWDASVRTLLLARTLQSNFDLASSVYSVDFAEFVSFVKKVERILYYAAVTDIVSSISPVKVRLGTQCRAAEDVNTSVDILRQLASFPNPSLHRN